jgi:hypothetical protein
VPIVHFVTIFAVACWPTVLLGVILLVFLLSPRSRVRQSWQKTMVCVGIGLVFIPTAIYIWLQNDHVEMVADRDISYVLLGGLFIVIANQTSSTGWNKLKQVCLITLGFSGVGYGIYAIAGDFFFAPRYAAGAVEWVSPSPNRYLPRIYIGGVEYKITADLKSAVAVGTRIRVEYGAGSRTIFRIEPLTP